MKGRWIVLVGLSLMISSVGCNHASNSDTETTVDIRTEEDHLESRWSELQHQWKRLKDRVERNEREVPQHIRDAWRQRLELLEENIRSLERDWQNIQTYTGKAKYQAVENFAESIDVFRRELNETISETWNA
jgi:chromosome segregation ATPase